MMELRYTPRERLLRNREAMRRVAFFIFVVGVMGLAALKTNAAPLAGITGICPDGTLYAALSEVDIPCPDERILEGKLEAPHTPAWLDVIVVRPLAVVEVGVAGLIYYIGLPIVALTDYSTDDWRNTMLARPIKHLTAPLGSY